MSRSARSLFVFALYLFGLGAILLSFPNVLLRLFTIPETNEIWIRVVGLLAVLIGYYYTQAARHELTPIFRASVCARTAVLVFFIVAVVLGLGSPMLILFGVVDFIAAMWTLSCLKKDAAAS